MLTIRLQRVGRKNSPDFRIVLAEKHRAATKKVIEVFGEYNPKTKLFHLGNQEGLMTRIKQNVELSPTLRNLLINQKVIEGKKVKAWRPKPKEATEAQAEAPAPKTEASTPAAKPEEKKADPASEKQEDKKPESQPETK